MIKIIMTRKPIPVNKSNEIITVCNSCARANAIVLMGIKCSWHDELRWIY